MAICFPALEMCVDQMKRNREKFQRLAEYATIAVELEQRKSGHGTESLRTSLDKLLEGTNRSCTRSESEVWVTLSENTEEEQERKEAPRYNEGLRDGKAKKEACGHVP